MCTFTSLQLYMYTMSQHTMHHHRLTQSLTYQLSNPLSTLPRSGLIGQYRGLSPFLFSLSLQRRSESLVAAWTLVSGLRRAQQGRSRPSACRSTLRKCRSVHPRQAEVLPRCADTL